MYAICRTPSEKLCSESADAQADLSIFFATANTYIHDGELDLTSRRLDQTVGCQKSAKVMWPQSTFGTHTGTNLNTPHLLNPITHDNMPM